MEIFILIFKEKFNKKMLLLLKIYNLWDTIYIYNLKGIILDQNDFEQSDSNAKPKSRINGKYVFSKYITLKL